MMYRKAYFILGFSVFLFSQKCFAQIKDSFFVSTWYNYSLIIGDKYSTMSLYLFDNDSIKGNYYEDCEKKIDLQGYKKNGNISLTESCNGKIHGYIFAKYSLDSIICHGTWYDSVRLKSKPLTYRLETATGGTYEHRYLYHDGAMPDNTDEAVDSFAQAIQTAIILGNKTWIANNISYPINVGYNPISIESKKDFLIHYDSIFLAYQKGVKSFCPHNFFWNASGVDFGGIWIGYQTDNGEPDSDFAYDRLIITRID